MLKNQKEKIVEELKEKISRSQALYLADFTGITVEEINNLRCEFYKAGVDYHVVKNTLVKKALGSVTGYDKVYDKLVGPTAIAFAYDDPIIPAKIIKKFNEKTVRLKVKSCVIEKQVLDGTELDKIATMPTRPEMIAGILGSINAPISGVVGAINAVILDLVNVIDAIEKKKAA
ncbi:MAG: 50S ribosomal protein L10 [Bacteroidota bacterium]|nr:50S ribosomal protein L10 [Bacteroidota bacterium]